MISHVNLIEAVHIAFSNASDKLKLLILSSSSFHMFSVYSIVYPEKVRPKDVSNVREVKT